MVTVPGIPVPGTVPVLPYPVLVVTSLFIFIREDQNCKLQTLKLQIDSSLCVQKCSFWKLRLLGVVNSEKKLVKVASTALSATFFEILTIEKVHVRTRYL